MIKAFNVYNHSLLYHNAVIINLLIHNIVAASQCRIRVTSALLIGQFEDNEWNVFSNKLMNAINNSKSIK
jgi:hypothetical protein